MLDKKINKISAKNSNVIIGDNANIQNINDNKKISFGKNTAIITVLIALVTAIIKIFIK